jgi:nicotinic acid mononucleotide adenylyltransferase
MLLALRGDWPELAIVASNQARIIDQARALTTSFEKEPDALTLRFVVGFDTLERLFAARYYTDMDTELAPFFESSRVIASNRADVSTADVQAWIHKHAGPYEACIDVVEIDEFPASLSSSQARDAFAANATTVSVPAVVGEYIRRHGLYSQRP